jgi:Outer membrane protein beta-barrel domain
MKKIIILFFATIVVMVTAKAQFSFGPKAGLNISKEKYSNTAVYSTGSHNFFTAGAFANYRFKEHFAGETGIYYSAEGTEENYKSNGTTVTGVVTIRRINVPLLFQYHTSAGLYLETGPQIGFMISAKGDYSNGQYDFKKYTQSTFMSWCIGAGYTLKAGVPGLGFNAAYAAGLSRIDKGTVNAGKITGSTLSIKLFYGFVLKKRKV